MVRVRVFLHLMLWHHAIWLWLWGVCTDIGVGDCNYHCEPLSRLIAVLVWLTVSLVILFYHFIGVYNLMLGVQTVQTLSMYSSLCCTCCLRTVLISNNVGALWHTA